MVSRFSIGFSLRVWPLSVEEEKNRERFFARTFILIGLFLLTTESASHPKIVFAKKRIDEIRASAPALETKLTRFREKKIFDEPSKCKKLACADPRRPAACSTTTSTTCITFIISWVRLTPVFTPHRQVTLLRRWRLHHPVTLIDSRLVKKREAVHVIRP